MKVERAVFSDCPEILTLQLLAYTSEAEIYNDFGIAPLVQSLQEVEEEFSRKTFLKIVFQGKIIGSIRGYAEDQTCFIEKIMVHPDFQNHGLGTKLIRELEGIFSDCHRFELFTGHLSRKNLYLYTKLGYQKYKSLPVTANLQLIFLEKEKTAGCKKR